MSNKLAIVTLSIDRWTVCNKIIRSMYDTEFPKLGIDAYVFNQGHYCYNDSRIPTVEFIRDDTVYDKGYSISEIRDYFFKTYRDKLEKYEYIYIVDDDTTFKDGAFENILEIVKYMDDNPKVGIVNSFRGEFCNKYDTISPMKVGTRSGMLVRAGKYYDLIRFGGKFGIRYYEESYLALNYYLNGFTTMKTNNSISTRTKKGSGITDKLREKYGDHIQRSDDLVTGWTVVEELGFYKFNPKYNDHFHLGEFTQMCIDEHLKSFEKLDKELEVK